MKTDKHKLQAALVRSFFDAFSSGVIDCGQGSVQERRQPQNVKRAMLDYYEQIAPAFFETVFFPLAVIHSGYEEMERMVRKAHQQRMDMRSMLLAACGSEAFYEALVAEYKRNFSNLLAGRYATTASLPAQSSRRARASIPTRRSN